MADRCPKCDKKLSFFYVKQTCSECGCDILNYNREERLERDAEKAEEEFAKLDAFVDTVLAKFKIKRKEKDIKNAVKS